MLREPLDRPPPPSEVNTETNDINERPAIHLEVAQTNQRPVQRSCQEPER